jgi:hypothetical protein
MAGQPEGYFSTLNALPENKLWSIMERLQTMNGCHFFMACHPQRPKDSYQIDFSVPAAFDYVPMFRYRCGVSGTEIFWPGSRAGLNEAQVPFVQLVDGRRSIREILEAAVRQHGEPGTGMAAVESFVLTLFQALWRVDFVAMALQKSSA